MKFDCPYCRKKLDLLELHLDADLHAIIAVQETFGRHRHLVWSYLEIFGVRPLHVKTKKIRLLLEELKTLFQAGEFPYQKKRYRISQTGIAEALNIMVHRNFPEPLSNHNYLKAVMITIAEREGKGASFEAEKDSRAREKRLQAGDRSNPPVSPFSKGGKEDAAEPPFEKGGQGGFYDLPEEHVLPPMRSMLAAELTDAQIAANKERVRNILNGLGG